MKIQKLKGTEAGHIYEIGGVQFLMLHSYFSVVRMNLAPTVNTHWTPYEVVPYGFTKDGEWVISENDSGMYIGLALNAVNRDKKTRVPRDEFLELYKRRYAEALMNEIATVV